MMQLDPISLLTTLVNSNPGVVKNPRAMDAIDIIKSNDATRGAALADNLCRTYGVTRDEALKQARSYFHL